MEDIELLKKLRTGAKISISKKINKIKETCKEPNSKESVEAVLEAIKRKYKEAQDVNNKLKSLITDEPEKNNLSTWEKDLCTEVETCEKQISEFFLSNEYKDSKSQIYGIVATKQAKIEIIETRITGIKTSMREKCSNRKIELLTKKLQETHENIKQNFQKSREFENDSWLDSLELSVDNCLAEAADYCEKNASINNDDFKESKKDDIVSSQLKRIEIPKFKGDKENYFHWKSAFKNCVDSSSASDEIKLLHLYQYLEGNALTAVNGLGHSSEAYKLALQILEDKYGGERRKTTMYLEQVEKFPPLRNEKAKELEKFVDLLYQLVLSLQESSRHQELGHGVLYIQLQKKLTSSLLTQYHKWVHEHNKYESVLALKEFITLEMNFKTIADETLNGLASTDNQQPRTLFTELSCIVCKGSHSIEKCPIFEKLNTAERWNTARKYKLCYSCLGNNHTIKDCKLSKTCSVTECKQIHNPLLHPTKNPSGFLASNTHLNNSIISLRTIPIIAYYKGKEIELNALLDDGSSQTFIDIKSANELNLMESNTRNISVTVLGGNLSTMSTSDVQFKISGIGSDRKYSIDAITTKDVVGDTEAINWDYHKSFFPHLQNIPFSKPKCKKIDILIGIDHPTLHRALKEIHGNIGEPIARLTPLGWTCIGKTHIKAKERYSKNATKTSMFISDQQELCEIDKTLQKFWEVESIQPNQASHSPQDLEILTAAENSISRCNDGTRYKVSIPWKENLSLLQPNLSQALARLKNTETQLKKNPNISQLYTKTINHYIAQGFINEVSEAEAKNSGYYMPHFPVIKLDRQTTKVRIVFDASSRYLGLSLNDCTNQGPSLQQDIVKILTRFRKNKVAIICDIAEMYMNIEISEKDRKYFRFLWREQENSELKVFEFSRLIFGGNASPFLAQLVSRKNAENNKNEFPRAYETVLHSTYMDDSMDSVENTNKGIDLYKQLSKLWERADMCARKWLTNDPKVFEKIPRNQRAIHITLSHEKDLPSAKTLGIIWNAEQDIFMFQNKCLDEIYHTKRFFLKVMASIFDPLGFLAPLIIRAKILMQKLWIKKYDWDEEVEEDDKKEMVSWLEELGNLSKLKIPRCLSLGEGKILNEQIHIFVDASEKANAAMAYLRLERQRQDAELSLICCKTKIAPIHAISMPRLELIGAKLGVEIANKLKEVSCFEKCETYFWTDSEDVLGWIRNISRLFKPFVAQRVSFIQENSRCSNWNYIESSLNPADLATRGLSIDEMTESKEWLNGPKFLSYEKSHWPTQIVNGDVQLKEKRSSFFAKIIRAVIEPTRYSSWKKLYRRMAWIFRFISNCRSKVLKERTSGPLSKTEILNAEQNLILATQKEIFTDEIETLKKGQEVSPKSKIACLNPIIGDDGLLRSNSRINGAEFLNFDTRCPIILPRGTHTTQLIVKQYHEEGNHIKGVNGTLCDISSRFWVISAREEIRNWEAKCNGCKRRNAKAATQIMAALPQSRLGNSLKAFWSSGLDYAGPFETKVGRGKSRNKRYLCLFTCMATRAVHLELAYSLSTDSFLNCFWRFVYRRGCPSQIISDNGKNFVAGEHELRLLIKEIDFGVVKEKTSQKKITWEFNPPYAPHHGGAFESLIKSAKRALYSQLANADFTDEELQTAISGAEHMLNSRPITYQSASPRDITPLTPNHFLIGNLGNEFAPPSVDGPTLRRWRRVQEVLSHFWNRFIKEWLPSIGKRNKWTKTEQNICKGDIVLVLWPNTPRNTWPLGKITEAIEGKDGLVRSVLVQVNNKTYRRGLNTIFPLKIEE